MAFQEYPSKLLEQAVTEFAKLPSIGRKSALKFVLHLLRQEKDDAAKFYQTIERLCNEIVYCKVCKNISDQEVCSICSNIDRDHKTVCVVESIKDVLTIERTKQHKGVYHVLGGTISPMDGIGPSDLEISSLIERAQSSDVDEIILALSTTMEGDTTNYYLYKRLKDFGIRITTLARGVAIGDELEFTDEVTLGRSIVNRLSFEDTMGH